MGLKSSSLDVRGAVRLITIVESAANVGLAPVTARLIHMVAYMTNALSPVWNLAPFTEEVLKLVGGPYDPLLQQELDRLVGRGVLLVRKPRYEHMGDEGWRLTAEYEPNLQFCQPILESAIRFPDELEACRVVREICLALAAVPPSQLEELVRSDLSYADPNVSPKSVVDLTDEEGQNRSSRMAQRFAALSPRGAGTTPAEEAHLYIRHMLRAIGALSNS